MLVRVEVLELGRLLVFTLMLNDAAAVAARARRAVVRVVSVRDWQTEADERAIPPGALRFRAGALLSAVSAPANSAPPLSLLAALALLDALAALDPRDGARVARLIAVVRLGVLGRVPGVVFDLGCPA